MVADVRINPCTVCGTPTGRYDVTKRRPFRNENGWCGNCKINGGKKREILKCIDCETLGGKINSGRPHMGPARIKGRCKDCYGVYIREEERKKLPPKAERPNKKELAALNRTVIREPILDLKELDRIREKRTPKQNKENKCDAEQERRIRLLRYIQEYRAAEKNWVKIKANTSKQTEIVLLSA